MQKPEQSRTLSLVSLGCAKNMVDLQVRLGAMVKEGWRLSPDPDFADTVIVNTCSFIASARKEAEDEIRRVLALKERGQYRRVIVTGCYPERYPKAKVNFPGVDEWIGVPRGWCPQKVPGLRLTGKAFAYLKIAEGCSHRCAYCAIPGIRGKFTSRPMSDILKEAKALLATGCRELNIVAQDPMLWHEGDKRLSDLLWKLDKFPDEYWVRVLYSYPSEIDEDFVIWMMTARHAVHYVDIPVQHTVPEVLAKMNRRAAIAASLDAADFLRDMIPDITLRTTIMTGFPGETPKRFSRLQADLRRMQFDYVGAFAYSPEEGTKGAKMRGRPPFAVAEARAQQVRDEALALWRVKSKRMVGTVHRALVVAPGIARMASQAPDVDGIVWIDGGEVGSFVDVRLKRRSGYDFKGEIVK